MGRRAPIVWCLRFCRRVCVYVFYAYVETVRNTHMAVRPRCQVRVSARSRLKRPSLPCEYLSRYWLRDDDCWNISKEKFELFLQKRVCGWFRKLFFRCSPAGSHRCYWAGHFEGQFPYGSCHEHSVSERVAGLRMCLEEHIYFRQSTNYESSTFSARCLSRKSVPIFFFFF